MFTWQQVAKHNTAESAWVYVDDTVYDVTSFIDRHPGGRDMILLMAGRDITDLFRTYHPFTETPMKVIQQFKIGKLKGRSEFPIFQPDSGFYKECRLEIGRYFKDNNLDYKVTHFLKCFCAQIWSNVVQCGSMFSVDASWNMAVRPDHGGHLQLVVVRVDSRISSVSGAVGSDGGCWSVSGDVADPHDARLLAHCI